MKDRTIILAFLLVVLLGSLGWYFFTPRTDDESMIAHFFAHRAKFEELRSMLASDTELHRVAKDWVRPRDYTAIGVSDERLKTYRTLMSELGLRHGVSQYDPAHKIKCFNYAGFGIIFMDSMKGYEWRAEDFPEVSSQPEGELVANVDAAVENYYRMLEEGKIKYSDFKFYRKINDGWYLFYGSSSIP